MNSEKNSGDNEEIVETGYDSLKNVPFAGAKEAYVPKVEVINPLVESLAVPLARDYAEKNYPKREDGTFEPAWRGVNGEKDYKNKSPEQLLAEGAFQTIEEARAAVIDIANQPYNEYSEYWKEQNRGGAEFLVGLTKDHSPEYLRGLDLQDEKVRSYFGRMIHDNWLERNEWVKDPNYGDPKLAVPFDELDPVEQQKDIDQLAVMQKWLAEPATVELFEQREIEKMTGAVARGAKLIYPERMEEWAESCEADFKGVYGGLASNATLDLMEKIDEGAGMEEINKWVNEQGFSGCSFWGVLGMAIKFSKRGPQFGREYLRSQGKEISPDNEKWLKELEAQNERFEWFEKMRNS